MIWLVIEVIIKKGLPLKQQEYRKNNILLQQFAYGSQEGQYKITDGGKTLFQKILSTESPKITPSPPVCKKQQLVERTLNLRLQTVYKASGIRGLWSRILYTHLAASRDQPLFSTVGRFLHIQLVSVTNQRVYTVVCNFFKKINIFPKQKRIL